MVSLHRVAICSKKRRGYHALTQRLSPSKRNQTLSSSNYPGDRIQSANNSRSLAKDTICINIKEDDGNHMVRFSFKKFPSQFCQRCRKLVHREEVCEDLLVAENEVQLNVPVEPAPPPLHNATVS